MKRALSIMFITLILVSCSVQKQAPFEKNVNIFNFGAAQAYFELVDHLQNGNELTDAYWNNFLDVEGNKLYIEENNISVDFTNELKQIITDVYTVSKGDTTSNDNIFYQIRNKYKNNDSVYRNHINWLKANKSRIVDSMVARTVKFLPNNKLTNNSLPMIYYHALDHDGSANAKGIFISVMAAYQNNRKRLANYEAHEFHHTQRPSILENMVIEPKDVGLLWALDALLNEGLADMVDKDVMLAEKSDWWLKDMVNEFYVGKAEEVIYTLDKLIIDESKGINHSENEFRDTLLGTVGHVPGYYMAKVVMDNGKGQEMIKHADSPFAFFLLYNHIAKQSPKEYPTFSDRSIIFIKELQLKYKDTK